eukprot:CAMPEP_0119481430 /NCGR_PEP_ID=MMETSP1344-20130328/9776_1 /TAXON_ID=236787 /ORGANISM="Florenciella parvula, Strain CCMP2471" /LENGTH=159 /DNA_ID=CAMNT_0007515807 /DNA_START=266 /DNA_END=745 /DNA_ORIENTATION=-
MHPEVTDCTPRGDYFAALDKVVSSSPRRSRPASAGRAETDIDSIDTSSRFQQRARGCRRLAKHVIALPAACTWVSPARQTYLEVTPRSTRLSAAARVALDLLRYNFAALDKVVSSSPRRSRPALAGRAETDIDSIDTSSRFQQRARGCRLEAAPGSVRQ